MTTETTTSRRQVRIPLRWRIVAWITLTATVGIALLLALNLTLMRRDIGTAANRNIVQEVEEFRSHARSGTDPVTGRNYPTAGAMVLDFLSAQRPGDGEIMLGYVPVEDRVYSSRGADTPDPDVYDPLEDQTLLEAVLAVEAGVRQTPAGEVRWGRSDVIGPDGQSSFIVLVFTQARHQQVTETGWLLLAIGAGTLLLTGLIAWWVSGRVLRPVREVQQTAEEISERDLTRRLPVEGRDELADLASTFNAMLTRLEQAFGTQQKFVDDAGHELRTPITIIRGHLELMGDDPEDRAATVEIVTGELDRMNRIVTDLLTLAKAERPDYIQIDEPIDVADLTMDLDAKVQSLGERRWLLGEIADGPALIDEQRVAQAVLQLAANATQHTEEGDTITLASRFDRAPDGTRWVSFFVADTGPGVAAEDRSRIFDRFSRVTADGSAPGAGLGLAIVRTIAEGHGGDVRVDDTPGGGATFVLSVPAGDHLHERTTDESSADS